MKRFSFGMLGSVLVGALLTCVTACNFKEPEPAEFLSDNIDDWKTHFQVENEEWWAVAGGKLVFQGLGERSKITIVLDSVASDSIKPGRITASVLVNDIFKEENQNSFYGFQLSTAGGRPNNSFTFGLNGAGNLVAFDHNMEPLPIKVNRNENCTLRQRDSTAVLYFAMYGNDKGWIFDCLVKNCGQEKIFMERASVVTDIKTKFDKLSLVAYKPVDSTAPVWFSNLKIWKDWVPFD